MKLVMVLNRFPKFSETFIVTKLLGLLDRGWDVQVLCNRSEAEQWQLFPHLAEREDVRRRIHVCPSRSDMERALTALQPDIVHFEFGGLAVDRIDLPKRVLAQSVVSFRGPDLNVGWFDDPHCYDAVWESADAFHFLGDDLFRRALRLGAPDKLRAFIPPGIDLEFFDGARPPHSDDLTPGQGRPLRVLTVARLHWSKGHEYALRAIRTLVDRGVDCRYEIVGAHDHKEHLLAVMFDLDDLGLQDVVTLAGRRSREYVRDALRSADVFLHAAVAEGFCNAAVEAQAMGVPVVCSDADGLPENVEHGVTGFVVPRRSSGALVEGLQALAADAPLRQAMGSAGRFRAQQRYAIELNIERFHRLYLDVLEQSGDPLLLRARRRVQLLDKQASALQRRLPSRVRAERRARYLRRLTDVVHVLTPPGARLAVVSRGDDELVEGLAPAARHFPAADDGSYLGYHPGDTDEALAMLSSARSAGAEFLLFPEEALWWLEYYEGLVEHLWSHHGELDAEPSLCRVFDLRVPHATPTSTGGRRRAS